MLIGTALGIHCDCIYNSLSQVAICEIGFNGGHSAAIFLAASASAKEQKDSLGTTGLLCLILWPATSFVWIDYACNTLNCSFAKLWVIVF